MTHCPSCSADNPPGGKFCSSCGGVLEPPSATLGETTPSSQPSRTAASSSAGKGRLFPGSMLTGRYRVVGLLGRGGMGEVYRADDLKLGQPVALKFLPPELEHDAARRERFLNEVRTARQVTHVNVCRVYDVGEEGGRNYLSMEYVDGEDLAILLRRIGRLPEDKAVQIARQMCLGVQAAHEQGILHRDLKPSNVMIDGRGQVKITDFGLANLEEALEAGDRSGTPAYMAPEQLAGEGASVATDIYSLGLVLYELFTGKRAFEAATAAGREPDSTPARPSTHVEGLDPAVERAILRCLEPEPPSRPPSALAVAAALPGGDPLAAALVAGETPSPQVVADAGSVGALRPAVALSCLALFLAGSVINVGLNSRTRLAPRVRPEKPTEVLVDRARELVATLGYGLPRADDAHGWLVDAEYLEHVVETDGSPGRWDGLSSHEPPALQFWYRQSPRLLVPTGVGSRVSLSDPPSTVSGMVELRLDPRGRLLRLRVVPPQVDESAEPSPHLDWSAVFAETALSFENLTPVPPSWLPPDFGDRRMAWEDASVRVEAAAYRGRPISFRIIDPWTRPERSEADEATTGERVTLIVVLGVLSGVSILALLLARQNLRRGRGDRVGATKLALFSVGAVLAAWALDADHAPSVPGEMLLVIKGLSGAVLLGAAYWIGYVALEPFVRRRWPQSLTAWSRLLAGRFRDPLVGRSILVGAMFQMAIDLLGNGLAVLPPRLGLPPILPPGSLNTDLLLGGRRVASGIPEAAVAALSYPLIVVLALLLLRIVLRRQWLAMGAFVAMNAANGMSLEIPALGVPYQAIFGVVLVVMVVRFGLLTLSAAATLGALFTLGPVSLDFSVWYASHSLYPMVFALGLVLYGFYTSLGGQRVVGGGILDVDAEDAR